MSGSARGFMNLGSYESEDKQYETHDSYHSAEYEQRKELEEEGLNLLD